MIVMAAGEGSTPHLVDRRSRFLVGMWPRLRLRSRRSAQVRIQLSRGVRTTWKGLDSGQLEILCVRFDLGGPWGVDTGVWCLKIERYPSRASTAQVPSCAISCTWISSCTNEVLEAARHVLSVFPEPVGVILYLWLVGLVRSHPGRMNNVDSEFIE